MSRLYTFPFLSAEEIANSPSRRDGWTPEKEASYRKKAIRIIFETAKHKPFPNMSAGTASMATAYYLRFYTSQSLARNSAFIVVCAALFLAGKANDEPRSLDALSVEILKRWYGRDNVNVRAKLSSREFIANLHHAVESGELALMMAMGFDLNFELPHPYITRLAHGVPGLKSWRGSGMAQQFMLSFCNDIFKCDPTMVLQYSAREIALAAFNFYFKQRREDPPAAGQDGSPWFVAEGLSLEVWKDISHRLVTRVYTDRRDKQTSGSAGGVATFSQSTVAAASVADVERTPETAGNSNRKEEHESDLQGMSIPRAGKREAENIAPSESLTKRRKMDDVPSDEGCHIVEASPDMDAAMQKRRPPQSERVAESKYEDALKLPAVSNGAPGGMEDSDVEEGEITD